jgi:hypothetical protein
MSVSAAGKVLVFWGLFTLQTAAWATVYELPTDGSSVFGTDQRIKATYKDTLLDIRIGISRVQLFMLRAACPR